MPPRRVNMPPLPLSGGCQCGRVRYRITETPHVFYLCHCRECQRHTSSAFGKSLRIPRAALEIDGDLKLFVRGSDSGNRHEGRFCATCGVRIVHGSLGDEMINIKAGTLDDATWLRPAGHIWTVSKQAFFAIGPDELAYERQPEDGYAQMAARWRTMLATS